MLHRVRDSHPAQMGVLTACGLAALAPSSAGAVIQADAEEAGAPLELLVGRSEHVSTPWPVKGASVTDPTVADLQVLTPDIVLISGRGMGKTDVLLWGEGGETWTMEVRVEADVEGIQASFDVLFPGLRVARSGEVLVVSGVTTTAEEAVELHTYLEGLEVPYVNRARVPGVQQVQVQVRMAEVSRTGIRTLGINAFAAGSDYFVGSVIGPSTGGPINPISIAPELGASAFGDVPFVFNPETTVSPAVTLFGGGQDFEVFVQALEENQFLRILAEPNLVALSGEEASFLAGGEFPIPVVQGSTGAGGGTSITIEYKEFGVGLKFRPIVLGEGKIRLEVASEVSELTDIGAVQIQGFRVPSIVTRRADTTLEMRSGQTFAMAGLLNESSNAIVSKTPFLGSLPILGTLFRSVSYRRGETELLVLVTASLVEPMSNVTTLPVPGAEHLSPNDWELYLGGQLSGRWPGRLDTEETAWFEGLGLDELRGPGAWATHEEPLPMKRGTGEEPERKDGDG